MFRVGDNSAADSCASVCFAKIPTTQDPLPADSLAYFYTVFYGNGLRLMVGEGHPAWKTCKASYRARLFCERVPTSALITLPLAHRLAFLQFVFPLELWITPTEPQVLLEYGDLEMPAILPCCRVTPFAVSFGTQHKPECGAAFGCCNAFVVQPC